MKLSKAKYKSLAEIVQKLSKFTTHEDIKSVICNGYCPLSNCPYYNESGTCPHLIMIWGELHNLEKEVNDV